MAGVLYSGRFSVGGLGNQTILNAGNYVVTGINLFCDFALNAGAASGGCGIQIQSGATPIFTSVLSLNAGQTQLNTPLASLSIDVVLQRGNNLIFACNIFSPTFTIAFYELNLYGTSLP